MVIIRTHFVWLEVVSTRGRLAKVDLLCLWHHLVLFRCWSIASVVLKRHELMQRRLISIWLTISTTVTSLLCCCTSCCRCLYARSGLATSVRPFPAAVLLLMLIYLDRLFLILFMTMLLWTNISRIPTRLFLITPCNRCKWLFRRLRSLFRTPVYWLATDCGLLLLLLTELLQLLRRRQIEVVDYVRDVSDTCTFVVYFHSIFNTSNL